MSNLYDAVVAACGSSPYAAFRFMTRPHLTRLDGFAANLLEDNGVQIDVRIDADENYGEITGVHIERLLVVADSAAVAFNRAVLDPLKYLYDGGFDQQVVLLIDALDEALQHQGTETILDLISNMRGLPRQIRLVLTARPETAVLSHFEHESVPHLILDAASARNIGDIEKYISQQLDQTENLRPPVFGDVPTLPRNMFIEQLAHASGGNFLYLVWLLRAIAAGTQRLDTIEDLPQRLDGIYREFLRTRTFGRNRQQWRSLYRPVLGVLAAAQAPLSVQQIVQLTGRPKQDVLDALLDVQQFLEPLYIDRDLYLLYHHTIFALFEEDLPHSAPRGTSVVSRHTSSHEGAPCECRLYVWMPGCATSQRASSTASASRNTGTSRSSCWPCCCA